MGFGVLLIGYFLTFAFTISEIYFFIDVIGALVMLYAFTKLSEYNRYFQAASVAGILFTLLALASGVMISLHMLTRESTVDILLDAAKSLSALGIHVFVFLGIKGIAEGADCPGLAEKAVRNLVRISLYYVLYFGVLALSSLLTAVLSYVSFLVYLYFLVCFVTNLLLFHSCFGMLYPAEGDPMEKPQSRIPFFNKLNDAFDRLDEKKNAYRKESMDMALAEAERRAELNKHKPKKKKKKK